MVTKLSDTVVATQLEGQFQHRPELSSGLDFVLSAGIFLDGAQTTVDQTTVTLTDDAINSVIINLDNTPATLEATTSPPNNVLLLYKVTTVSGVVTSISDLRWRAMSSRLLGPSWDKVVTSLNPDAWWKLDEASLPMAHTGSAPEEIDFSDGPGPGAFQQTGPTGSGSAVRLRHGDYLESSGEGLEDIGSSPDDTGTFVVVFHTDVKEKFSYIFEEAANFDIDGIALRLQGNGRMGLHLQNGGTTNYDQIWEAGTIGGTHTGLQDDQWHMVAMIQTGLGGDNSVIGYLDGVLLPSPDIVDKDVGILSTYWINDFGISDVISIGKRGSPDTHFMRGSVDELMYFAGVQLTADNISSMWNTIKDKVSRPETLASAIFGVFGKPHHYLPLQAEVLDEYEDLGSATTLLGPFSEDGPIIEGAPGFNDFENSIQFTPIGVNNGDRLIDTSLDSADDTFDLATGSIGMMFQIDDVNTWDANLWGISNEVSTPPQQGWIQQAVDTQGADAGRLYIIFHENSSGDRSSFRLDLHTEGVIDVLDGEWHMVIVTQSGDNTGVTWYVDGREYTPSSQYIDLNITSTYGLDGWCADVKDDSTRFALGGNAPPLENNMLDGKLAHWFIDGKVINAAEATRLWNATGL